MLLKLYFPQETITTAIIITDFDFTEVYYNDLKPAENSARLAIMYNTKIANYIKINVNNNVKAEIKNSDNSNYFTGYLKKSSNFSKETKNNKISLEIVSPSILFNKTFESEYWKTQITVSAAIQYLLELSGINNYNISNLPNTIIPVLHFEEGEEIKSVLTELLFEYGFIYDFNNDGVFVCNPLFNQPSAEIAQNFIDGSTGNLIGVVNQTVNEKKYDGVSAEFRKLIQKQNQLIFEDTSDHVIAANGYLYDNQEGTYTNYDCTVGEPFYIETLNSWKVATAGTEINNSNPENSYFKGSIVNYGNKGLLKVQSKIQTDQTVNKVQIYGSGYFFPEEAEKSICADGTNREEITLDYIFSQTAAANLAEKLRNYYKYSSFKVVLKSYEDFDYGSFCVITVGGMGTIKGRILQKKKTLESSLIEYTIEAITDYTPAEVTKETSANSNKSAIIKEEVKTEITPMIEEVVAPLVVSVVPRYRGSVSALPEDVSAYNLGDWIFLNTEGETEEIGIYKLEETGWSLIQYESDGSNDSYFVAASKDILGYANESEEIGSFAVAYISKLFTNKIIVTGSVESENYSSTKGFKLNAITGDIIANTGIFNGFIGTLKKIDKLTYNSSIGKYQYILNFDNLSNFFKTYSEDCKRLDFYLKSTIENQSMNISYVGYMFTKGYTSSDGYYLIQFGNGLFNDYVFSVNKSGGQIGTNYKKYFTITFRATQEMELYVIENPINL